MFGDEAQRKTDDLSVKRRVFTDQFVLFDEAAKLSTRNQLAPLPQDQLRTEDDAADETRQGVSVCGQILMYTASSPSNYTILMTACIYVIEFPSVQRSLFHCMSGHLNSY